MLIEDYDDLRQAMAMLLKCQGHTVVEASTVAEGISRLNGQTIALLELALPDGSGIEVLQQIRKQDHHTRVAIITSAYDLDAPRSLLVPGDTIFSKPFDFDKLLNWIEQETDCA